MAAQRSAALTGWQRRAPALLMDSQWNAPASCALLHGPMHSIACLWRLGLKAPLARAAAPFNSPSILCLLSPSPHRHVWQGVQGRVARQHRCDQDHDPAGQDERRGEARAHGGFVCVCTCARVYVSAVHVRAASAA